MNAISGTTEKNSTNDKTTVGRAKPLLIVDASNVAFGNSGGGKKPCLAPLQDILREIPKGAYELKMIADASLRHRIDRREEYENLVRSGEVLQTPAGRSADQFMAQLARKRKAEGQKVQVLTNDLLREYPDLEPVRVTFLFVGDGEVVFDPPFPTQAQRAQGGTLATPEIERFESSVTGEGFSW